MGTYVLLHVVQALQRRLVASYKRQLGWDDERGAGPVDTRPHTERKPVFTLLALTTALAIAVLSVGLYFGAHSGFEGWGAMFVGVVIAFFGTPVALVLCLVAMVRERKYLWVNLISIAICLTTMLWLYSQN